MRVLPKCWVEWINLWLLLVASDLHPRRVECGITPDWKGGDWAMESLMATEEPIGISGEWSDYVYTLAGAYDEDPNKNEQHKFVTGSYDERDWRPLGPNDIPYVAVLVRKDHGATDTYKKLFPNDPDPETSHIEPGTACGGAFLTPQLVLSSCGCLVSLISKAQQIPAPFSPIRMFDQLFNIYDQEYDRVPDIYVTKLKGRFINLEYKHVVEMDGAKWPPYDNLNCKERLMYLEKHGKYAEDVKKAAILNSELVVVPFTPAIHPSGPVFFPKWPPHPINEQTDRLYREKAELVSLGMVLSTPPRFEFYSSVSATATELQHRKRSSIVCDPSRVPIGVNVTCFGAVNSNYNLAGGTIGWPLVVREELVGLTASERDPADGTVLVAVLHPRLYKLIEDYIGKNVLEDQNTPAPVYRSQQLLKKYQIYDYSGPDIKSNANYCCTQQYLLLSMIPAIDLFH